MLEAETLAAAAAGDAIGVGYPSRAQSRVLSPVEPACVAQDDVEPLLLARLPADRVLLGTEVTGLRGTARRRCATCAPGRCAPCEARYVVAADGAQSTLRRAARHRDARRRGRAGGRDDADPRAALGRRRPAPPPPLLADPARGAERPAADRARPIAGCFAAGGGRRRADRRARPARGAGVPDLPVRVERSRRFSSAAQLAERFRAGPRPPRRRRGPPGDAARREPA